MPTSLDIAAIILGVIALAFSVLLHSAAVLYKLNRDSKWSNDS